MHVLIFLKSPFDYQGKLCGVLGTCAALAPMPAPPWWVGLGWWMGLACAPVRPRLPKVGHGRANCFRGFAHPCPCRPRPPICACHGIVRTLLLAAREEPTSRATLASWVDGAGGCVVTGARWAHVGANFLGVVRLNPIDATPGAPAAPPTVCTRGRVDALPYWSSRPSAGGSIWPKPWSQKGGIA